MTQKLLFSEKGGLILCGGSLLRRRVSRWTRMNKCSTSGLRNPNAILNVIVFLLSSLVTAPSFVSVSLLVLELWYLLFIRDLGRNQEIKNTPIWIFSNMWRLRQIRDTKFSMNVSNKNSLNAAKYQVDSLWCFSFIKRKPNSQEKEVVWVNTPHPN